MKASQSSGPAFGWRHIVTILCFFGFFFLYSLKVNLSVAIVAMLNHTAIQAESEVVTGKNVTMIEVCASDPTSQGQVKKDGPFDWDAATQGNILGAFFYGYIVTQVPGGLLATKFGAKWVFGLGTFLTAVFALLTPVAANAGAGMVIFVRVLMGIAEGVTWPASQALFAKWAPPSERSKLPSFAISGCFIGTVVAFIASGFLADSNIMGGWPSVFYCFGIAAILWFIIWTIFVSNGPEGHRFIGNAEKTYIVNSLKVEGGSSKGSSFKDIPLKSILTSIPIWAAMISHFTYNWALYVLLTGLPLYFKNVLGFDLKSNGVLSSIPYLVQALIQSAAGQVADTLRTKCKLSTTCVRKLMDCFGHLIPAICVIFVGYVGCNSAAAVALLTLSVGFSGLCGGGFFVNYLDLCPQYTGLVFGISNTLATIPGILGPNITGWLTKGEPSFESWRIVFFIAGALYFFSVIFYAIFGKGTLQPWAQTKAAQSATLATVEDDDT
ncbi:hypothetical protein M514_00322 [Trichuris suis]|uniref:Sialin n=1 Tax=Trichuris suis TaxID=68888 RepID=A0A085MN33_9BILA|nr:hypothetical protein M513_00322 [Trichuris suis]KFD68595.1 hypothetical protein M514_00322 [Trichuris suis]